MNLANGDLLKQSQVNQIRFWNCGVYPVYVCSSEFWFTSFPKWSSSLQHSLFSHVWEKGRGMNMWAVARPRITLVMESNLFHLRTHWEGAKIVQSYHHFLKQLTRHTCCRCSPPMEPTDKWPFPKFPWHTCRLFTAHQCGTTQWLKMIAYGSLHSEITFSHILI